MMAVSKPFSGLFSIADFGLSDVLSIHREIGRKLFDHKAKENFDFGKLQCRNTNENLRFYIKNSPCSKKTLRPK